MQLHQISEFLKKFTLIEDPSKEKSKVVEIIKKHLSIPIKEENLKISRNTIIITLEPAFKSVFFTQKTKMMEEIEGGLAKKGVKIIFK